MSYEKYNWEVGDILTSNRLNNIQEGIDNMSSSYQKTIWVDGDIITAQKLNNIENQLNRLDDIWSGGSGDSIPVEWTTIVDEEAAEFIYNQTTSSCDANFYFNHATAESWPTFNVFNLMVDGEALGASAPIGGSSKSVFNNNDRYYTVDVAYTPYSIVYTVSVLNEDSFVGTHAVKIDIGLVGSESPSSSEG